MIPVYRDEEYFDWETSDSNLCVLENRIKSFCDQGTHSVSKDRNHISELRRFQIEVAKNLEYMFTCVRLASSSPNIDSYALIYIRRKGMSNGKRRMTISCLSDLSEHSSRYFTYSFLNKPKQELYINAKHVLQIYERPAFRIPLQISAREL